MCLPSRFPGPHYVRLLSVPDQEARRHYEEEALRGGWSVRQLDRQISTLSFQRSRSEQAKGTHADGAADFEIKDPFVLEFLGLKDEYSEAELEEALIRELEHFLLELGNDFAFIARQKRLRVGTEWYRVDLLFFHRRLRSLIIVELKLGKFTHADAGQMNLYLNYAREHWKIRMKTLLSASSSAPNKMPLSPTTLSAISEIRCLLESTNWHCQRKSNSSED